ncbi:ABC transporter ATP-binding protein [Anaerotalea alkaliphila]|uniref:ABC-type quaternary amine transporter n=1 Tax=Anaerotalea alkaliphila TaxID=2662126 RepID=A0A7X5HUB4_9FIRM|nr:ABC transporter ATP-binding protein [Anaerotalea alkaliphila]NDL66818.1 ABC transporter ATP-binding protein [Anaerotalea alkaliphila]
MIQLKQVSKSYGSQRALAGIDLEIPQGECAVLIGPSGCGKSTLLKTINRMVAVDGGEVVVDGKRNTDYAPEVLRRQIGYCIQGVGLFPHFTVRENIAVVPRLLGWKEREIDGRIRRLLDMSGLPSSYLGKKPGQLSGGESQRVGVCRALAADPPVLLMDEPFGAVDPLTREKLQLAFNQIQEELKKTVVFVTHDVEEAILLADRVVVMNQGRIVSNKAPGKFAGLLEEGFVKSFLGNEYPLRLLKRYSAKALHLEDKPPWTNPLQGGAGECLTQETNLKEVLSEMMRRNEQALPFLLQDNRVVQVEYMDIVHHLHAVSK